MNISVIIPVKNGALTIRECIEGILHQSVPVHEIIVIDSGSKDGSVEIVKEFDKVRLVEIPENEFNHGATRNMGVEIATGDYIIMTVQDAIPSNEFWIEKLLEPFAESKVMAVCGQQIVLHDKNHNPVEWFRPQNKPTIKKVQFSSSSEFDELPPREKMKVCGWDNVTACYKREVLLSIPFKDVTFAEDALWAMEALRAGYCIAYNSAARVYHYHDEPKDFAFRRALITYYHRYKFFNFIPGSAEPGLKRRLQILKLLLTANLSLKKKLFWWRYNMNVIKAKKKALKIFKDAINQGPDAIEDMYNQYCSISPMAGERNLKAQNL